MESDEKPVAPPNSSSPTGEYQDFAPRIEFRPASKRKRSDVRRVRFNGIYFAAFGVWALAIAFAGEPVYGILSAFVLFEMALAVFRVSTITGQIVTDQHSIERITTVLIDLCTRARCIPPRVELRSDSVRSGAVRRRKGKVDLILSIAFVEAVTDRQLRAIVAHELIHVVRNDLRFGRVRAMVAAWGGLALGFVAWFASGYLVKNLPVFLAASAAGTLVINVVLSPLNRRREVRADVEGAALSADAPALADALTIAYAISDETRDRLYGRPPWRWLLSPLSWRMPTHPPKADRIARLRQLG